MTRTPYMAMASQEFRRRRLAAPQVRNLAEQRSTAYLNNGALPSVNQVFVNVAMLDAWPLPSPPRTDVASLTYDTVTGRSIDRAPATVREQWIAADTAELAHPQQPPQPLASTTAA